MVFWSNKLDFVAEMDVINSGLNRCRDNDDTDTDMNENSMGELWKKFMYLFEDEMDDRSIFSVDFIVFTLLKFATFVFIIPLWIALGAITFGMLWPPQVRAKLMTSRPTRPSGKASAERHRMERMVTLREDVSRLQDEIKADIDKGRQELNTVRNVLEAAKSDIHAEMNNVKDVVTELF